MLTDADRIRVLEEQLAQAVRDRSFTQEWYAVRFERLKDLMKEHGIWDKGAAIIANGTLSGESDSYWGKMNSLRHRAEEAERELRRLKQKYGEL